MKKLLAIIFFALFIVTTGNAQILSNGTGGGEWNNGLTWEGGVVPNSTQDVTIQLSDEVTIATEQSCDALTITSGATLTMQTGANLSTGYTLLLQGILNISVGVLNVGNSKTEYLEANGGTLNFSGGTINVAGRYKQLNGSNAYLSGSALMNISTAGVQTSSIKSFSVTTSGEFFVDHSSTVQIILKYGNSSSAVEIYYSPTTSNFNGGAIIVENASNLSDIYIDSDMPIYKIESKVGTGNTLHFNPDCNFSLTDLTITSGQVQIDVGANIDITGNATLGDANALLVKSNSTGNGSFIASGTVTGTVSVERYFAAYTNSADGWHLIGSPVDNMTISGSDFDPAGTNNDLYAWDEDDYIWRNFKGSNFPGTTFTNGLGYMVAYEGEVTNTFSGSLNTSDVTFTNLSQTPAQGDGWHLLGNPYSSALKWNDGNWTLTDVGGVAKVYNESTGNYDDINTNGIIPSTNGFFVQVSSSTNTILIPSASRVHNATNNYKNSDSTEMNETLRLMVNNDANNFSDITSVGFRDDAETTFDWAFDSHKMFGQSIAPQLWTVIEGEELSTNKLPLVYESLVVPLYFKAGVNSVYHILAEGIESFYLNSDIYLEDKLTGSMIDLRDQPMYTFEGFTGDDNYRFDLHFFGVTNTHDEADIKKATIYSADKDVFVRTYSNGKHYKIELFDITGRRVLFDSFVSTGLTSFRTDVEPGMYFVLLRSGNSVITKKLYLR